MTRLDWVRNDEQIVYRVHGDPENVVAKASYDLNTSTYSLVFEMKFCMIGIDVTVNGLTLEAAEYLSLAAASTYYGTH